MIDEKTVNDISWHSTEPDEALEKAGSTGEGLSKEEASERLESFGPNRLKPPTKQNPIIRFLLHFNDVLIYILLGAAVVTALLDHWVDTWVIVGVVVLNAIIGFVQEGKAEKALEAISKMLTLEADVIRGGEKVRINSEEVVPGDIVLLASGDKVPADLRLLKTKELRIDESMLTGESMPAEKSSEAADEKAGLGDRAGMAFSGTLVTSGRGRGVVVSTGQSTQIGQISDLVSETDVIATPLTRQVASFGKKLAIVILGVTIITFLVGWQVMGGDIVDMFLAAVALAVAAIPEGLPAIMTIILAIGVRRMADRHAIIRRMPAVDTLGALTVICSDKTGTLTRNEMTVKAVITGNHLFQVEGEGYKPEGDILKEEASVSMEDHPILEMALRGGVLCNDAEIVEEDGQWKSAGDPMEGALLTLAQKAEMDTSSLRESWKRLDAIPFESENRYMATLNKDPDGNRMVLVKGGPERVLEMCSSCGLDGEKPLDTDHWEGEANRLASEGYRVLAVAWKPAGESGEISPDDAEQDLRMLALFGIVDPPRTEAIDAVKRCRDAGIRVKMITGDHATTARAIGQQMGIGDGEHALTGRELDELSKDELKKVAREVDVFARVSPEHKLRLVEALQSQGEVTAMTGDGVNDAPALKRADVGIAMGIKGTEVSKEAAQMVLTDDNFESIAHAVEEGRTVYDNLRKSILFILPTNGGEALTILLAIVLGFALPLTPVQVLWVNMVTAVTLALALAFEPSEPDIMKRPPRDPSAGILNRYFLFRIVYVSLILCAGTFGLFVWMKTAGMPEEFARTVAVNTLVMFEVFYLLNSRFLLRPVASLSALTGNRSVLVAIGLVIVFQLFFTYFPPLQFLFGSAAIGAAQWGIIVLVASSVFFLVEIEKAVSSRLFGDRLISSGAK